jgi:hypothetical protein
VTRRRHVAPGARLGSPRDLTAFEGQAVSAANAAGVVARTDDGQARTGYDRISLDEPHVPGRSSRVHRRCQMTRCFKHRPPHDYAVRVDPSDGHDVCDGRSVFVQRNEESVCQADKPADQCSDPHDVAGIDTNELLIAAHPDDTFVGHREAGIVLDYTETDHVIASRQISPSSSDQAARSRPAWRTNSRSTSTRSVSAQTATSSHHRRDAPSRTRTSTDARGCRRCVPPTSNRSPRMGFGTLPWRSRSRRVPTRSRSRSCADTARSRRRSTSTGACSRASTTSRGSARRGA